MISRDLHLPPPVALFLHLSPLSLSFPPTTSPLQRSPTYITLQQAPSDQRCLVIVLHHEHNPLPSSLAVDRSVSRSLFAPPTPLSSCFVATLHSLATYFHTAVNTPNETEIISGGELCRRRSGFRLVFGARKDFVKSVWELFRRPTVWAVSHQALLVHPSERLTPWPRLPTDGAGRAGREEGGLGPQPGPAGPVHRLPGEGADQNGQ